MSAPNDTADDRRSDEQLRARELTSWAVHARRDGAGDAPRPQTGPDDRERDELVPASAPPRSLAAFTATEALESRQETEHAPNDHQELAARENVSTRRQRQATETVTAQATHSDPRTSLASPTDAAVPFETDSVRVASPQPGPDMAQRSNTAREVLWPREPTADAATGARSRALPPRPTPPWRDALARRAQRPWPAFEHPRHTRQGPPVEDRPAAEDSAFGPAAGTTMSAADWDRTVVDNIFAEQLIQTLEELFDWRHRDGSESEESLEDVTAAGLDLFALHDASLPEEATSTITQQQWGSLLDIYPSDTQACGAIMDAQGIPWGSDTSTRAAHHRQRVREYPNYTNVPDSLLAREQDTSSTRPLQSCLLGGYGQIGCRWTKQGSHYLRRWLSSGAPCVPPNSMTESSAGKQPKREQMTHRRSRKPSSRRCAFALPFYSPVECTRRVRPTVVHFQLRHLLRATSEDDVYLVQNSCLLRYVPSTHEVHCLYNLSGQTVHWTKSRMLGCSPNSLSRVFRERPPTLRTGTHVVRRASGHILHQNAPTRIHMHSLGSWNGQRASNSDIDEYDVLDSAENQLENAQVVHRKPPYRNDGLRVQVSTMSSDGWLCIAGGFAGEIIGVDCRTEALCFDWRVAGNVENAITNYIELFYRAEANDPGSLGRARHMATANNDCFVRIFDLERCGHAGTGSLPSHALLREIPFSWPVNHVGVQPLGSWHHPEPGALLAIAGDHTDVLLVDRKTGEAVMSLHGHRDYSFATAWHPNGIHLATGNQDGTFRIWDVRRTDVPLRYVFPARLGAVRSLQYSDDGRFLCVAEVADWVHIVDAFGGSHEDFDQHLSYPTDERYLYSRNEGYLSETVIDVFGEIAGVSFSPARGEYLFVGISDPTYGCLMQYRRNRESFSLSRWITS